jgi:F0F1-type ATP synthase membrane subunit b/b'
MRISLTKAIIALMLTFYGVYLCLASFGVGKLAQSINDFQRKIEFKSCLKYKSVLECKEEVYN